MKISIAHHKARLRSHTEYLRREISDMSEKKKLIQTSQDALAFLATQIREAERRDMDEFDSEKFLNPTKQKP